MQRNLRLVRNALLLSLALVFPACESGSGASSEGYTSEECSDACNRVAGPNCGDVGDSCFGACVSFPNAQYSGDCQPQLKAYFECWWKADSYRCSAESETEPVGCDTQRTTYLACTGEAEAGGAGGSGSDAGAGGAGGNDAAAAGGSAGAPAEAAAGAGGASETPGAAGAGDTAASAGMAGATG